MATPLDHRVNCDVSQLKLCAIHLSILHSDALTRLGSNRSAAGLEKVEITSNLTPSLSIFTNNSLQDFKSSGTLSVPLW